MTRPGRPWMDLPGVCGPLRRGAPTWTMIWPPNRVRGDAQNYQRCGLDLHRVLWRNLVDPLRRQTLRRPPR